MSPEARAARERKQKIFVLVGGLFLLVLVAIQLPRLLGGSGGSETAAATGATTTSADASSSSIPSTGTPVSAPATPRPAVPTSDKLSSFGVFRSKDPFVQQVVTAQGSDSEAPAGAPSGSGPKKDEKKPAVDAKKFSLGSKAIAAPSATIVSVNGSRQTLEAGTRFPVSDPVFVLVAEHPESKSVTVGVVGGAYSGGSRTTKLVAGKPLTLVNTTTGARYRIVLVAVGSGEGGQKQGSTK